LVEPVAAPNVGAADGPKLLSMADGLRKKMRPSFGI
jgi:hypothetical protein